MAAQAQVASPVKASTKPSELVAAIPAW